jgi:orotidine-5'-phosphate decarboxylase
MDIVECAKQNNLIVIADAKRGDIASSATGYAEAVLGKMMDQLSRKMPMR